MNRPDADTLFAVLDATWPARRFLTAGPWRLREGAGGGKRVSAASAIGPVSPEDIDVAEDGMRALGQAPLFMIRPEDAGLDAWLSERGYEIVDPVTIYAAPASKLAKSHPPAETLRAMPPLAIQAEIWGEGGIGPARLDVMTRATCARTTILGRVGDRATATVYVGAADGIAMVHALETARAARRRGGGRKLMEAAAAWAVEQDAAWLTLAVTKANVAANALYSGMGMEPLASYHYRVGPGAP